MDFTIKTEDLKNLVNNVYPALENKELLPAFTCIKLEALPDGVALQGFSNPLYMKTVMHAQVKSPGVFGIPGKPLHDILSKMPPEQDIRVHTNPDNNRLAFSNSTSTIHLNLIDGDQFPLMANFENLEFREVAPGFLDKVDKVAFCASKDETRYHLQGVHFTQGHMVATDGHRMAILNTDVPIDNGAFTLPADSIKSVRKIFDTDGAVNICEEDSTVHLWQNNIMASLRKIEGKFPNYQQLIPNSPYDEAAIRKSDLKQSLSLLTIITDKKNGVVFNFQNGSLDLDCETNEIGHGHHRMECQFPKDSLRIALNAKYIAEAIDHIDSESVTWQLRDNTSPIILTEKDYVQVIMPQRLN